MPPSYTQSRQTGISKPKKSNFLDPNAPDERATAQGLVDRYASTGSQNSIGATDKKQGATTLTQQTAAPQFGKPSGEKPPNPGDVQMDSYNSPVPEIPASQPAQQQQRELSSMQSLMPVEIIFC